MSNVCTSINEFSNDCSLAKAQNVHLNSHSSLFMNILVLSPWFHQELAHKRALIACIWNWVMNFGTGSLCYKSLLLTSVHRNEFNLISDVTMAEMKSLYSEWCYDCWNCCGQSTRADWRDYLLLMILWCLICFSLDARCSSFTVLTSRWAKKNCTRFSLQ